VVAGIPLVPAAVIDPARLVAVARSGLLDTDPEQCFDDLVHLACDIVEAEYGFFTVVDAHRSFWKSAVGLPAGAGREARVEDSLCQVMIAAGAPLVVDDAQGDDRVRDLGAVRTLRMGACLTYPVRDGDGQIIGGLSVSSGECRTWTAAQQRALETLARAVSAEVQLRGALTALRAEADGLELARDKYAALARSLQQGLLPPSLPAIPGLDAAASYLPAGQGVEVVGDFYDLFAGDRGAWVVIGDVCGHGVEAAKLTALARYTVRSQATEPDATPARVLKRLNDAMRAQYVGRFLTAAVASIRPAAGGWVGMLCSAGHEPPLIRRTYGTIETPAGYGRLLGVQEEVELSDAAFSLARGDALVLVTDGVTEARSGSGRDLFGEEGLAEVLAHRCHGSDAAGIVATIMQAVENHSRGYHADDTAVLVVRPS